VLAQGGLIRAFIGNFGGHEIELSPADAARVVFDVGTAGGTNVLWAQVQESNGQETGWQRFTVTAPPDTAPVIALTSGNVAATHGQTFAASSLYLGHRS
jgi:hypothetical protein